ncbi:hypothetical protein ACKFKG_09355 [Phormidesmis sp. 146-35]
MNITNADLPAFSTVEEIAVWAIYTLQQHNKGLKIVETELGAEFFANTGIFTTPSGEDRLLLRATVPLKPNWILDAAPRIWKRVDSQSNVAIQAGYKTNS